MSVPQINTHVADALARLISQFDDSPRVRALVSAPTTEIQTAENVLYDLLTDTLDSSVGAQLDQHGAIVGLRRNGLSDPDYRQLIKVRILANRSDGLAINAIRILALAAEGRTETDTGALYIPLAERGYKMQIVTDANDHFSPIYGGLVARALAIARPSGATLSRFVEAHAGAGSFGDTYFGFAHDAKAQGFNEAAKINPTVHHPIDESVSIPARASLVWLFSTGDPAVFTQYRDTDTVSRLTPATGLPHIRADRAPTAVPDGFNANPTDRPTFDEDDRGGVVFAGGGYYARDDASLLTAGADFTIAVRLHPATVHDGTVLAQSSDDHTDPGSVELRLDTGSGWVFEIVNDGVVATKTVATGLGPATADETDLLVVRDGTNLAIYQDSTVAASTTAHGGIALAEIVTMIGARIGPSSSDPAGTLANFFDGQIRTFAVWDTALDAGQRQQALDLLQAYSGVR